MKMTSPSATIGQVPTRAGFLFIPPPPWARQFAREAGSETRTRDAYAAVVLVRLGIAAVIVLAAMVIAVIVNRRRKVAPVRDAYPVPAQLDRRDFPRPDSPWLVVLFSSQRCDSCLGVAGKVDVLRSAAVETFEACEEEHADLHRRYEIAGIPTVVIADAEGVVRRAFVGAPSATDLWAAVAELRAPGATPEPELGTEALGRG
jgi:hypothetical protein